MYVKAAAKAERRGADEHRRRLLAGLSGTVVEIGAGHGLNFAHYPAAVAEIIAIEPEPTLRAQAEAAASAAPAGGCHPARDTTAAIQRAGFDIETIDRFGFAASNIEPSVPHILGTARRS